MVVITSDVCAQRAHSTLCSSFVVRVYIVSSLLQFIFKRNMCVSTGCISDECASAAVNQNYRHYSLRHTDQPTQAQPLHEDTADHHDSVSSVLPSKDMIVQRYPNLRDIKNSGWFLSDSLQSRSSDYADATLSYDADYSDSHEVSDSNEDLTLTDDRVGGGGGGRGEGQDSGGGCQLSSLLKPVQYDANFNATTTTTLTTTATSSRKSSATSDSAIDLHNPGGHDDTSGDTSPVPHAGASCSSAPAATNINQYRTDVTLHGNQQQFSDGVAAGGDAGVGETSEDLGFVANDGDVTSSNISRLRRLFVDAQTPSFTTTRCQPPSVIISDHSQDNPVSPVRLTLAQGQCSSVMCCCRVLFTCYFKFCFDVMIHVYYFAICWAMTC